LIRVLRGAPQSSHRSCHCRHRRAGRHPARGLRRRGRDHADAQHGGRTVSTTSSFPIVPAFHLKGDPKKGKAIYGSSNCGSCHTLAAANSTGTVGPNLDQLKPDYRAVTAQVTNGGGAMPAFKSSLSPQQIADVSAYVVDSTGGTAP
jgi:mono/diheme cytochrome c family protein